jgi:CRISPR-associated exonuclease Cas4
MAERDPRFIRVRDQLGDLISSLNQRAAGAQNGNELELLERGLEEELKAWGVKVSIEVSAPDIEKIFELGTDLHLDDGIKTSAERKRCLSTSYYILHLHFVERANLFCYL